MLDSTRPLYQHEESLRSHVARVTRVHHYPDLTDSERALFHPALERTSSAYAIETNETIFYAQGGGQPFDLGSMELRGHARFDVEAVRSAPEHRILHFGFYAKENGESRLAAGDMVEQHIDGARRDLNSRAHTAGHLVALAVLQLAKEDVEMQVVDGKASHFPDACWVEFKGLIDGKFKKAIAKRSNECVKDRLPVELYWCKPDEVEERDVLLVPGMPVLTGPDGMVRIVDIVGAGAYPCGGTHVQHAGLVGEISIRGIKRQKGISKVSYSISAES